MTLNLSGITPIPLASVDVPSDALAMYNFLVNQINAVLVSGGTGTGPAFNPGVAGQPDGTGALASASLQLQMLILVELRCIANFLGEGLAFGDRQQMRADELYTLTNSGGVI
jgi:hypothetical protein